MSATRKLAAHAVETTYDDLPAEVVSQTKHVIRDSLGCLIGGARLPAGEQLRNFILPMAAAGSSTVAGTQRRAASALASYVNAQLTNLLDYDDTLEAESVGHPGATIIPPALALAEETAASAKALLTAVVVGYDVFARVSMAGRPTYDRRKRVRGLATWQVFGAVAAAAHLLGLDREEAARAFGLTALHAPVPFVGKIYEERPMWGLKNNYGWAAMGGVLGALYAAEGVDGNHEILECDTGFWAMAGSDRFEPEVLTHDLGTTYSILETSFKPYPCCRFTHSTLDAVNAILRATDIVADDVRAVHVYSSSRVRVFDDYNPQTFIDAEFSLPYSIAMSLLREPPGYRWVTGERWRDPTVLSLAERVHLHVDPEAEADWAKGYMRVQVSVELDNGRTHQAQALYARGHPSNPLSAGERQEKFFALAEPAIGRQRARELDMLIDQLDEVADVSALTRYLTEVH